VRGVTLALVAVLLGVPQALWRIAAPHRLPGPLPRLFHRLVRGILGIRIDVVGTPVFGDATVWAGNHLSYLDIPVLGSLGPMRFVAKDEVAGWPLFGRLADLQRTIYISRRPREAVAAAGRFAEAVRQGGVVVLFPEGTSSDGGAVLPFRASILQPLFDPAVASAEVQPFTLCLQVVDGRDADSGAVRDLYAYHGDMALVPHLRAFLALRGATLRVVFHPPVRPQDFADRRALAAHLERQVAWGLAHGTPAA
jgi:1-acyl-sn-glycerol-3-phosphate acyltransferase